MDGDHPGRERGLHVVVDPVADVDDLVRRPADALDDAQEELGRRLLDAEPLRGRDVVHMRPDELLVGDRHVADRTHEEPAAA